MAIILANGVKDLATKQRVFPFISLTLTPLIIMHVFTVDVKLAKVVKLLIERVFKILTYDFFDIKSHMKESSLK